MNIEHFGTGGGDNPLAIIMVEDDPDDVQFMRRALKRTGFQIDFLALALGGELVHVLEGWPTQQTLPLVLLDINLHDMNGLDVLSRLRRSNSWKAVPVLMFSTSQRVEDVTAAYAGGANAYIKKPAEISKWAELAVTLCEFWGLAQRPQRPRK